MKEQPQRKRDILCTWTPWCPFASSKPPQRPSVFIFRAAEIKLFHPAYATPWAFSFSNQTDGFVAKLPTRLAANKKSFKYDLCSAEEVLRSPALLVQWCLSKGFYNNVSTVDGSCVIYRKSSNRLQQSVLDFNQLFSTNLGGMHHCV